MKPLVTVITACLNGGAFLAQAIDSVRAQTFADWELLIVDDGSTDGSDRIAAEYAARDARIVLLATSGRTGAAAARNVGLRAARGRFVAFLDCDDWWSPNKLEAQLLAMSASGAAFCATPYVVCDAAGRELRTQRVRPPLTSRRCLTKQAVIGCLTVMIDVEAVGAVEFATKLRKVEDFALWVRLLRRCEAGNLPAVATSEPLAFYRVHGAGQSRSKLRHALAHWPAYTRELSLSWPQAAYCFACYVVNGLRDRLPARFQ
jgi:teichuronic acid biosynthesis glycosyltransferase TuaG